MAASSRLPIGTLDAAMDTVLEVNPVFLTTAERAQALRHLSRHLARVEAARMRILAASDDIAVETGDRSTAHWLARETRDRVGTTRMLERIAVWVDERWTRVGTAMGEGAINLAQAREVTEALDALPTDLDPELGDKGEA